MLPHAQRLTSVLVVLAALAGRLVSPLAAQLAVTPDGAAEPNRLIHTSGWTAVFTVANNGSFGSSISLTCATASVVTSCSVQSTINIPPGQQANVNVTYAVGNVGTGTVTLKATGIPGTDEGFYTVPVTLPGGAPRINAVPYLEAKQEYGRCAASCFAATYAQTTIPYFSLDRPRNLTLVYHGDRVKPRPFVHVDVAPDSSFGTWPSEYQLMVKINSVAAKFVNGDTVLRFTNPANLTYRIGGQIDTLTTNTLTDGTVYPMEILVTSKIGAVLYTNRWVTRYLTVNETASPIARGWTLGGIQRAYLQADSSLLIKEGDGSAVYFKKVTTWGVTSWQAPAGEFSSLAKSGTTFVRAYPDSTKVTFNGGLMVKVVDRWGAKDSVVYDGTPRPTAIRDPANQSIALAYGANGLSSITDPGGRVTNVTVQANKTLTAIRDPDADSTRFGYDGQLRLSTITNRLGRTTTLGYLTVSSKETNKLVTVTAPSIPVNTGGSASPVTTFAPWHTAGVPYGTTATTAHTPPRADTVYARVTEPQGASYLTRYTVNRWGSPLVTTNPLGEVTTITYTADGQPSTILKPGFGSVADTLVYDASGLVTRSRPAGDSSTTVVYGGWAQPATVTTPGRPTVTYSLGANGRVNSVAWGGSTRESYTYDGFGRLRSLTNGVSTVVRKLGYATTGMQNHVADTLPGGRIASYAYDSYGRRTTVTPPASSAPQEVTHYSTVNRVDSVRVLTSPVTRTKFTYDKLYLTAVTDPKNQVYSYSYNDLGWVIKQVDPVGARDTFQYNVGGELKRKTNRRNQNLDFSYDVLHRLTSRTGSSTATWTYTANSLVVAGAVSGVSTVTTYPSKLGPPDSVTTVLAGSTYRQRYRYTSAGLDSVWFTGSQDAAHFTARKYPVSPLTGVLSEIRLGANPTGLGVDQALNPISYNFPGGASRTLVQATIQQPTKSTTEAANNTTLERWTGLDTLGRITRHLRSAAKLGWWFSYDSLGQLRTARYRQKSPDGEPGGCPNADYGMHTTTCTPAANYTTLDSVLFTYDAVGNRTDKGGTYTTGNRVTAFDNCSYKTWSSPDFVDGWRLGNQAAAA
ncbi:MAG: RHS repeat protein [Gemmatimonadetes bacterium]|nr:RHS repeat protein [Gemmatimonadota bacterium]